MKDIVKVIAFDKEKFITNEDNSITLVEKLSCGRIKAIDDFIIKQLYEAYKDTDISKLFIIDETEFARYLKATLPQYLKKKTEKDIYDFVNRKLEETKAQRLRQPFTSRKSGELGAKIEAYEEVLNFIGTIRMKGK